MDEKDYKAINEKSKPQLKQTAVDWLVEQLTSTTWKYVHFEERMEIFRKAKQMEKEQMFEYIKKLYCNGDASLKFHSEEFEQYYNKTYKK